MIAAPLEPIAALAEPDPALVDRIEELEATLQTAQDNLSAVRESAGLATEGPTMLSLFHEYIGVFVVAFLIALVATPICRRLAVANGVIDRPNDPRKAHGRPIAYLGGVAVYLGIIFGILFSYTEPFHSLISFHETTHVDTGFLPNGVPLSIILGMTVIMVIGLWDDVVGIDPRAKIAGQLFAAAALALENVGVNVAAGLLLPIARMVTGNPVDEIAFTIPLGFGELPVDIVYWTGTGIIAVFVLGGCNAANLIDGLDGLLSGTTAIAMGGCLLVALGMAVMDDGVRDASRIVLCLAVFGACLGFLPHNFNPANIFLGDCGSMLLGYCTIVIILTLGDSGKTHYMIAGLVIYAIPIIDTTLAIVRRKISGKSISAADDQHLHHMLKRALGVKGAVFALYGIGLGFAALGVFLTHERGRVTYAAAIVFAAFIGVTALKIARRAQHEQEALASSERAPDTGSKAGVPINGGNGSEPPALEAPKPESPEAQA